jgi:hypothetical protein
MCVLCMSLGWNASRHSGSRGSTIDLCLCQVPIVSLYRPFVGLHRPFIGDIVTVSELINGRSKQINGRGRGNNVVLA